jgi:hypothetical protein
MKVARATAAAARFLASVLRDALRFVGWSIGAGLQNPTPWRITVAAPLSSRPRQANEEPARIADYDPDSIEPRGIALQ